MLCIRVKIIKSGECAESSKTRYLKDNDKKEFIGELITNVAGLSPGGNKANQESVIHNADNVQELYDVKPGAFERNLKFNFNPI